MHKAFTTLKHTKLSVNHTAKHIASHKRNGSSLPSGKDYTLIGGAILVTGAAAAALVLSTDLNAHSAEKQDSVPVSKSTKDFAHFTSQSFMIPHPKKAYKGGEDGTKLLIAINLTC
jgi:hypothetical protein